MSRYIRKVNALADIHDLPNGAGIGYYSGRPYVNGAGQPQPLALDFSFGEKYWVDGDNGVDPATNALFDGRPFKTPTAAISKAAAGDTIFIRPRPMAGGASDPVSYAETLIIPAGKSLLRLVGFGSGPAQGAQPQIKKGAGSAAQLTIRSPGCQIVGLSINGGDATGGGILLDDDSGLPAAQGGETKSAFGTIIADCFFKNCEGATHAGTGGAIQWSANGGAWQVLISGCHLFKCRGGIVMKGTGIAIPKDVVIEDCTFDSDDRALIDCDIFAAADGINGLIIRRCAFGTVDVPGYGGAGAHARYIYLTGSVNGHISDCTFACTGKTFGNGDAAVYPVTVRSAHCYQENAIITRT